MFNHRTFFAVFLLLCLAGCQSQPGDKPDGSISIVTPDGHPVTVCDLPKVSSKEEILLSDLVEEFEIIHLDNSEEAFFKAWLTTVTENHIGVRQHSGGPFKLFDRKGNFLHNIGQVGNGPGEYSIGLYDEIIDERNGRVYFAPFMGDKILVYGLDGSHIKDLKLPFRLQKPKIELTDKGHLIVVHMPFPGDEFFAFEMDLEGNILRGVAPREGMLSESFDGELFSYRNGTVFDIYLTSLDTLYHLNTHSLEIAPVLTSTGREESWFCVYSELPQRYLLNTFSWRTQESRMISTQKESRRASEVKLVNDYLGKLETEFKFNKGYFIENLEPGALIEKITNRLAATSADEDREKLNSLLKELNEDQNNVLLVGRLKHRVN